MFFNQNILIRLFRAGMNIFICPRGNDDLFLAVDNFLHYPESELKHIRLLLFIKITSITLNGLYKIHYVLGHVVSSMLMLESVQVHETAKNSIVVDKLHVKQVPVSRKVVDALYFLYHAGGIRMFCKGLDAAIIYHLAQDSVASLLETLVFRHAFLKPVAYLTSSALLAELHLHWTHATILATSSTRAYFRLRHDKERWKILAVPALVYGTAELLMNNMPPYVRTFTTFLAESNSPVETGARTVVFTETLTAFIMLALRFLVPLPASITLTLIETSFLGTTKDTMVPFAKKRLSARTAELFSDQDIPVNFEAARKLVHVSTYLWLFELHIKKCLIHFSVELLDWFFISIFCL
ncbi:MAG: hypothetical protein M1834_007824 [Cirrosporium novae-zelandiae]|nr:MAG: hypothetical protein M1834_007824 [Cirrosporium novae-zelandiae]